MEFPPDWERRSAWDNGLEVIDSLLQTDSATAAAMTGRQREGLRNLKSMLLRGGASKVEHHIPMALLVNEDATHDLLLAAYAGYHRPDDPSRTVRQIVAAHKAAKILKSSVSRKKLQTVASFDGTFLPPQWLRLDEISQLKLRDLLSWDNLCRWDFDIFEVDRVIKRKHTLVLVAWAILASPQAQYAMDLTCQEIQKDKTDDDQITDVTKGEQQVSESSLVPLIARKGYRFMDHFRMKVETLVQFLQSIENRYIDTPYHSKVHAADVTQSLHAILQMGGARYTLPTSHPNSPTKDSDSFNSNMELFAILLAAVVHDVGHPGTNNLYQIHSRSEIALRYNDQSVLENMHAATAFEILMGDHVNHEEMDILATFDNLQKTTIRNLMIKTILSTDMTKHFVKKDLVKGLVSTQEAKQDQSIVSRDTTSRHEILAFLLHLADISNPAKNKDVSVQWADRVLEECFRQGDREAAEELPVSPLCDRHTTSRAQSQIGFIKYIVLPSYELLGELIPTIDTQVIPILKSNLQYWNIQKQTEEEKKAKPHDSGTTNGT